MDNLYALIVVILWYSIATLAYLNGIGSVNEGLEYIQPKMRRVKLNKVLLNLVPQWATRAGIPPAKPVKKQKVYILTVVLALGAYINKIVWIIIDTVLYCVISKEVLIYCILGGGAYGLILLMIVFFVRIKITRIEIKNRGRLDRDFTIDKHDKKE